MLTRINEAEHPRNSSPLQHFGARKCFTVTRTLGAVESRRHCRYFEEWKLYIYSPADGARLVPKIYYHFLRNIRPRKGRTSTVYVEI